MAAARRFTAIARALAGLAVAACAAAGAADAPAGPPAWLARHDAAIAALQDRVPPATDLRFVVGNELWQPGRFYRDGKDWLALVCAAECSLQPAELRTRPAAWQGHYDDKPTSGQQLSFRRSTSGPGRAVAWFRSNDLRPWLAPGPVVTHSFGVRRDSPGTWEAAVQTPDAAGLVLVPLLHEAIAQVTVYLQLRSARQRQMLLGTLGDCSGGLSGTAYLLWAGDLDRDGRTDLLVSYVDADGPVHLYLSGAAAPGELVGLAGVYQAPPSGGECDGGGWLPHR